MPVDQHHDDDDMKEGEVGKRFKDFDCPSCAANNPYGDGFGEGDEVRCYYCGQAYEVKVMQGGRLKLIED
jgi:hypothetical protein